MFRGTTPTLKFKMGDTSFDLNTIKQVWITMNSPSFTLTKTIEDVDIDQSEHWLAVYLSQEETLAFHSSYMKIQIRILDEEDNAYATPIYTIEVKDLLKEGVIE